MKHALKQKQVTHICCLKTGDRFYFINDPKKKIWQLVRPDAYYFNGRLKKAGVCKDDNGQEDRFDANRVIVYIRTSNEKQVRNSIRLFESHK